MSNHDMSRFSAGGVGTKSPQQKPTPRNIAAREDAGIPEKVYVPYRALAMLSFTIAVVLGMFALLRISSKPETDKQILEQADSRAATSTATTTAAPPPADIALCVFNAGGKNGLAHQTTVLLKHSKFHVLNGGNFTKKQPNVQRTTVFYPKNYDNEANRVVQALHQGNTAERPDNLVDCPGKIVVLLV